MAIGSWRLASLDNPRHPVRGCAPYGEITALTKPIAHRLPLGTSGSAFASAWCSAVGKLPHLGTGSELWSFEPSLIGGYSRSSAPGCAPHDTGCAGNIVAWQYLLGSNGPNVDVDQDEALSSLPLWYPT